VSAEGPHQHHRQHQQSDRDVRAVKAGDGVEQRSVGIGPERESLVSVLDPLQYQEEHTERDGKTEPHPEPRLSAPPGPGFSPEQDRAAAEQDERVGTGAATDRGGS